MPDQDYKIIEKIHESANSTVRRAIRIRDNRRVILKILKRDSSSPYQMARYRQEYEIAAGFDIEGVIRPYGIEHYQGTTMIVFEDFGARSLNMLMQKGPFPIGEFLRIAIRISDILGAVHAANVIHKDINPSNIIMNSETGQVKLIDFGISTALPRENPVIKNPEMLEGTLAYISPEQTGRMNRSLDYRTDFYSLGANCYEMLTGRPPFEAGSPLELVHCHMAKMPVPPHEIKQDIPKPVSDIVMKLMSKNPEERYQSAFGIRADLEECVNKLIIKGAIDDFSVGSRDISDRFQIPQKLYGRESEIRIVLDAFDEVCGKTGKSKIIFVSGYSGIGKTALVREIDKSLALRGGYFISGKFDQLRRNMPYSGIISAFSDLMKQILSEPEKRLSQWREKLLSALGPNGRIITDVIPEAELIVGKQPPTPDLEPAVTRNRFNLVFHNFLEALAGPEHPLAIFLDDLQWADMTSLEMIRKMVTGQSGNLLLIGAFRDNEVNAVHPLMLAMDGLKESEKNITTISLRPLRLPEVICLISETFHCASETAGPLAETVFAKTGGNPFFINELLKSLYDKKRIDFDHSAGLWKWSVKEIRSVDISDNVVELTANRIQKISPDAQEMLKLAACIGNRFELETLTCVSGKNQKQAGAILREAIAENLIFPVSDEYKLIGIIDKPNVTYKFAHDRIQQAAYSLIPEDRKQPVHLRIGRLLLRNMPSEDRDERIFDIVNQLNKGIALITGYDERNELAALNFVAGKKAKASTAYAPALEYLKTGISLLDGDCWENQYKMTLDMHVEAAEAACLNSEFGQMEKIALSVLAKSGSLLDEVKIHNVRILAHIARNRLTDAIKTALPVLNRLGARIPEKPTKLYVLSKLLRTKLALAGKNEADLTDLPEMTNPVRLASMRIMATLGSVSFFAAPELLPLIVFHSIVLSVRYGNAPFSAIGYTSYGFILCAVTGEIDSGYRFGRLALDLADRLNAGEVKTKVIFIFNSFVRHWKAHVRETLNPFLEGYQSGLEAGDPEYAALCTYLYCAHSFRAGRELASLEREIASYNEVINRLGQETCLSRNRIYHQIVSNLLGQTENPCELVGEIYDERIMLPLHEKANDWQAIWVLFSSKTILCYLFCEYPRATENSVLAHKFSASAIGTFLYALFIFFDSLVLLAEYGSAGKSGQKRILKNVTANQKKMKKWAHHAPMNHLHRWTLVEAECARVLKDYEKAARHYDRAIALAGKYDYHNDEALALELAGRFFLEYDQHRIAKTYLRDAHHAYRRWGANAKVRHLENQYPEFFSEMADRFDINDSTLSGAIPTTSGTSAMLDIETVMRASQAISGEIILSELLNKMMHIVIESSGAEKAFFLTEKNGKFFIKAEAGAATKNITFPEMVSPEDAKTGIPAGIVNYVARTHDYVILDDAHRQGLYTNDPCVMKNRLKSVLCVPVISRGKPNGILYLENNLVAGAFTPEQVKVTQLLSSQIAISFENAGLYKTLGESEEKYRSLYERSVEGIFQSSPDGSLISANPAFVKIMGYDPEKDSQLLAAANTKQAYVNPEDQEKVLRSIAETGRIIGFETLIRQKNGNQIRASISARSVKDAGGNLSHIEGSIVDITERVEKEKAEREREAAEAASRAKSEFLANMSHEIRTPMNAIFGFAEILENEIRDDQHKQYLAAITSSGKTLLHLIDDILDLSKIEAGRMEPHYRAVDPRSMMKAIEQIFAVKVRDKGIELCVTADPSLPRAVLMDEARLRQILFNLVGNAVKFTENGFVELSATGGPPADLMFTIRDTGIGIPQEQRELIFESFRQQAGQNIVKYGGTGLGLAITKRLVELLNGEISVESAAGKGSAFHVKFRDVSPAVMVKTGHETDSGTNLETVRFGKTRILVVDDIKPNRDLLKHFLKSSDVEIIEAEDGKQAIDLAKRFRPGLILMDMKMPVIDGYEATKILKQDENAKSIPVIAISASAMKDDEVMAKKAGCDGFLRKPVSKTGFFTELMRFLDFAVMSPADSGKIEKTAGEQVRDAAKPKTVGNDTLAPNILLIEDNHNSRIIFSYCLKTTPHHLDIAENGRIGFDKYVSGKYDIIFMDMEMPVMGGCEATRMIRNWEADNRARPVPIIALTSHNSEEKQKECLDAGSTAHLIKPIKKDRVLDALRKYGGFPSSSP